MAGRRNKKKLELVRIYKKLVLALLDDVTFEEETMNDHFFSSKNVSNYCPRQCKITDLPSQPIP